MEEESGELDMATPMAQARLRMAREAISDKADAASSVYAGGAGNTEQTGQRLVQLSIAERAFQSATSFTQARFLNVQRVEEKTFRLVEETGIWRDELLTAESDMIEVVVGSDSFIELLERYELLGRYASIGEQVELMLEGQGYRFILPEEKPEGV